MLLLFFFVFVYVSQSVILLGEKKAKKKKTRQVTVPHVDAELRPCVPELRTPTVSEDKRRSASRAI